MTKDFEKRGLFLMDERMVDLIYHVAMLELHNDGHHFGADSISVLRAISDYSLYGSLRKAHRDDEHLMSYIDLLKGTLDEYRGILRQAGIIPKEFSFMYDENDDENEEE